MRVRWKIVMVVLPLLLVTIILVGLSAALSATTGINRVIQDFLDFKAGELQKQAESQWDLLVENQFTGRPEMVDAMQAGIMGYANSLLRTDTEIIIAFDHNGTIVQTTEPVEITPEDRGFLREVYAQGDSGLLTFQLSGTDRVGKGFYFEPFEWFFLIIESRDVFYRDVDRIIRESAIILVVAIAISLALLLLFAGQLTRPLATIATTMRSIIARADLTERVPVEFRDETGDLAHTFNLMLQELDKAYTQIKSYAFKAVLAQKKENRIRNIFQKYVPQELIDKFFQNPESMLVGENRELAILFSDIRSFTSISEAMRPDDLVNSLNRYFSIMVDIIMNRGGVIDKYIGDAIMAFYGAPVQHDDDAFQSIISGLEMMEALDTFNADQIARGKPEFQIGIGINYGEVTVGNIGTDKKMDYTVIGDMVNLASRLEGLTKPYHQGLIVAESLFPFIENSEVPWRLLDSVAVKGKKTGVKIYACNRRLSDAEYKGWNLHNTAMQSYYNRDFSQAIDQFNEVLSLVPDDPNALMILERCQRYKDAPPPEGWDGVEVLTSK